MLAILKIRLEVVVTPYMTLVMTKRIIFNMVDSIVMI